MKKEIKGCIGAVITFLIGVAITFTVCIVMELLLGSIVEPKTLIMLIGIVICMLSIIIGVLVDYTYKRIVNKNRKD